MLKEFNTVRPRFVDAIITYQNNLSIFVHTENLQKLVFILRKSSLFKFNSLTDLFANDWLSYGLVSKRFELIYVLVSLKNNKRIIIRSFFEGTKPVVSSLTPQFASANWLEREAWDLYGIFFENHSDLRRILTDYGFEGFPLRKDFPLSGYTEVRYDDELANVVLEPLKLTQEFRTFDFSSPWENYFSKKE